MKEHWICLDLSSRVGTLSLHRMDTKPELLTECSLGNQVDHSERLIDTLSVALAAHHLKLSAVDRWVASRGPGSFTGLRLALSALKAFAYALQKPLETVSGSEARILSYLKSTPEPRSEIHCLSYATWDKIVWGKASQTNQWRLEEEIVVSPEHLPRASKSSVILLDDNLSEGKIISPDGQNIVSYPLRARLLAEVLSTCQTRQSTHDLEGLITLSPQYFGAKF